MRVRRTRDALLGVAYLVVIAALVALSIAVYNHVFTTQTSVTAKTSTAGSSLQAGSDVKVRGILVGQVSKVTTDGNGADLHLLLDPSKIHSLPGNMSVQLLPKTLFGERYVNLAYPAQPAGRLAAGDTLHQDTSANTVELEKLFADLQTALTAVQPDKLSAALGEVSSALRGRGNDLGESFRVVGKYLDGLTPQVPQITDDLSRLADVADTYTAAAPDLLEGLESFTTTSKVLVDQQRNYTTLLSSLTDTGKTFGRFVGTNENQIIGLSADSRPSLELTKKYAAEFPCLSRALVALTPRVDQAFGAGTKHPGAKVLLHVTDTARPYSAADKPAPYTDDSGVQCPYVPPTALANTALADVPGVTGADTTTQRADPKTAGMGTANSPQENRLIGELMAGQANTTPAAYPRWASLVVGPALRGAQVSVK